MMKKKKPQKYEKPELKKIQLMAEEVLAISCKNVGGSGPRVPLHCGGASPCFKSGS